MAPPLRSAGTGRGTCSSARCKANMHLMEWANRHMEVCWGSDRHMSTRRWQQCARRAPHGQACRGDCSAGSCSPTAPPLTWQMSVALPLGTCHVAVAARRGEGPCLPLRIIRKRAMSQRLHCATTCHLSMVAPSGTGHLVAGIVRNLTSWNATCLPAPRRRCRGNWTWRCAQTLNP